MTCKLLFLVSVLAVACVRSAPAKLRGREAVADVPAYVLKYGE